MKRGLLLLLILPCVLAYYDAEELELDVQISNSMEIQPEDDQYKINEVTVYLSYYPREDYRQRITSMSTEPGKDNQGDVFVFKWQKPRGLELDFSVKTNLKTFNKLIKITDKVDFPIRSLGAERLYIEETATVDYTDQRIMHLASELAAGESDLAVVVHKLGTWVHENIEYDLNTKTSQASQKASWVIANQYGVCDELTNLFIGLCRSLGIPARFVSGISYTELELFDENWSPHGWAEVYFPGYGWVPYDVTYGQMGYIDPTHIKLKDSIDANKSSTRYEWEGYDVNLRTQSLDIDTVVVNRKGTWKPLLEMDAEFLKDQAGFESYNAYVVEIYNPNNFYVPAEITISLSEGLEYLNNHRRQVLLEPKKTKKEYWLLKLLPGQESNYIYNFTSSATTERNSTALAHLLSTERYKKYSRNEIESLVDKLAEEQEKEYSEDVRMDCSTQEKVYIADSIEIICDLQNIGNVLLSDVLVCIDDCQTLDIPIGRTESITFQKTMDVEGQMDLLVTAKNRQVTKTANLLIDVWGRPQVELSDLIYPESVKLDNNFSVEFTIAPKSNSLPQDVFIVLSTQTFEKQWKLTELESNRRYVLNVQEYALSEMQNIFRLLITYKDLEGNEFTEQKEFTISISNPSIKDRAILLLNRINAELKYDIVVLGIAVFIAGIVIGMIFKTRVKD